MSELAPIVLFVYNRPEHTAMTVRNLGRCELASESRLIIYSDAPADSDHEKHVAQVRELIQNLAGFKSVTVRKRESNLGLARSIIGGMTEVFGEEEKAIVLEDDMLVGKFFLVFMNRALECFRTENRIWTVSAYSPSLPLKPSTRSFFLETSSNQAWGSWRRVWNNVEFEARDFEKLKSNRKMRRRFNHFGGPDYSSRLIESANAGKSNSWAILYKWNQFKSDGLTLFSGVNLVQNIGWDGSGTNCVTYNPYGEKTANIDDNSVNLPDQIRQRNTDRIRLILFFYRIKIREFIRIRILRKA
ncbi:hypothetical protein JYT21_00335 [bacterium AH-315-B15]|nr:hypothetical protein [bacterium AH-315-B15]